MSQQQMDGRATAEGAVIGQVLERVLAASPEPAPIETLDAWWARHREAAAGLAHPVDRAIAGGFAADRPAYAFGAGYHEALRLLLGEPPERAPVVTALCATEDGGNHPRAIRTRLEPDGDGFRLTGGKRWTTFGTRAEALVVFASVGADEAGRNRLVAVRIPADRAGLTIRAQDSGAIVPEIPHATLELADVAVTPDEVMPGDGYTRYLKPFRTIEDICVHAALTAWHVQVARRAGWPGALVGDLAAAVTALAALGRAEPTSSAVHVALAGALAGAVRALAACEPHWSTADPETRARWQRDRALLKVAGTAREQRRDRALERLAMPSGPGPAQPSSPPVSTSPDPT